MEERNIPNYETFTIDRKGNVKDLRSGKLVPQYITKQGYVRVSLRNPKGTSTLLVHRLVAICFIDNNDNLPEVDHIDRNKQNNDYKNLRWACDIMQNNNKRGWGSSEHKYINFDSYTSCKTPYTSWVFHIRSKIYGSHKKRFKSSQYTKEDAISYRNKWFKDNHNIDFKLD